MSLPRIVALISGRGSNLQAIIQAIKNGKIAVQMMAVISNEPAAAGLGKAQQAGINTVALNHRDYSDRSSFEAKLQQKIDTFAPDLVILAGFRRVLGANFVHHYAGRLVNIHPSLLPRYRGLNTHARVLAAGDAWHGASVHFVTPELDGGPVIIQSRVPVLADDTEDRLAARVLTQEHIIYPLAVRWFCEQRLRWHNGRILFDGQILTEPKVING